MTSLRLAAVCVFKSDPFTALYTHAAVMLALPLPHHHPVLAAFSASAFQSQLNDQPPSMSGLHGGFILLLLKAEAPQMNLYSSQRNKSL